jgi:fumarate reductase subunit D
VDHRKLHRPARRFPKKQAFFQNSGRHRHLYYPIPYFIIALILQIVFAFVLGWFPLQATINTLGSFGEYIASLIRASVLPAVSLFAAWHRLVDHFDEITFRHHR